MDVSAVAAGESVGPRFNVVSVVPTLTLILFAGTLLASGAWADHPSWSNVTDVVDRAGAAGLAAAVAVSIVIGFATHPLQFELVRLVEGYWSPRGPIGVLAERFRERQQERRDYLAWLSGDEEGETPEGHRVWKRSINAQRKRQHVWAADELKYWPRDGHLMPTRLGNVLRAAEDLAGDRYGLDAIAATPRLSQLASPSLLQELADSRRELDVAARFTVVWLLATAFSIVVLPHDEWRWLSVPVGTFALAWVSYRAAISAGRHYGEALKWLVDLHHLELIERLGFDRPVSLAEEQALNTRVSHLINGERVRLGDAADVDLGPLPPYSLP